MNWGFRAALLYGLDYRFMASRGYINDNNLLVENKFSGFDTPMLYVNLYDPYIADGMNIILGRASFPSPTSSNNWPRTTSWRATRSFIVSTITRMWGLWTSTKLNENWVLQLGLADGVDIAPWETHDRGCQPTASVMLQWIGSGGTTPSTSA